MQKRKIIFSILLLIVGYIIIASMLSYRTLSNKNPVFQEKISEMDAAYLYNFYMRTTPAIDNRLIYGSSDAPITFIAVLDVTSESSRYFIKEIFPLLKEEFIDTGKMSYYHKNYLTFQDIEEKTDRFKYSAALYCMESKEEYLQFLDKIRRTEFTGNLSLECLQNPAISHDAIEVENFGTVTGQRFYIGVKGKDNTIINGIPSYTALRRAIRDKQIAIGE